MQWFFLGPGQPVAQTMGNAFGQSQQQFSGSTHGESMVPQKVIFQRCYRRNSVRKCADYVLM